MKSVLLFLATFVVGAVIALVARTALHRPYAAAPGNAEIQPGPRPVAPAPAPAPPKPAADPHAGHTTAPATPVSDSPLPAPPPAPAGAVVNTVCAICGMDVDPDIPPATYQGKLVGFGCSACPPKFAAEPDRYGPSALRNEIAPD